MKASNNNKIKITIPTKEMKDPNLEILFQNTYKSGYWTYRRGIPIKPRKCCGKNVRFTPKKVTKK